MSIYINSDMRPDWGEDELEVHPPSEHERWGTGEKIGGIDDVVKADEARFRALCKKHGFKMPKETKPKKKK